jgi:serine O-acetyltransferase
VYAEEDAMPTATAERSPRLEQLDPVWTKLRAEAEAVRVQEPSLAGLVLGTILQQPSLEAAIAHRIAERLDHADLPAALIRQAFAAFIDAQPTFRGILRADIGAVLDRDPACERIIEPVLYFKGFQAIETHRLAHWLWQNGRRDFALYLQSRSSTVFQVDIHPAAVFGKGIFLDHATGVVIGETASVGDDVSILQGVTLGGTGKEDGDRHPKVRKGVLIGAGAKILGNIEVGHCARIAAGSVVLKEVPPCTTVAGVPAKVIGEAGCAEPSRAMNQLIAPGIDALS